MTALELAVHDVAGIRIGRAVGVDRIELCTALATGGLTPSRALIDEAVASGTPVHVLIDLGVRRVLTSGGAARAVDALDELAHLVRHAGGALEVMAGVAGTMPLALGSADEAGYETTDEAAAREILVALSQRQAR